MKRIPLTQGQFAIVDDEDFERFSAHKWYALWNPKTKSFYAVRRTRCNDSGKRPTVHMHREVANAPKGTLVDHINHNTLDQRRENLRVCSVRQNCANRNINKNNSSGYKGVSWCNQAKKWKAKVRVNWKEKHLGFFATTTEAALAYDRAAIEYHGEYALTNAMLGKI